MFGITIEVEMGETEKGSKGDVLKSGGLGPCIAIAIYNPKGKTGIMMHDTNWEQHNDLGKKVQTAIAELGNDKGLKVFVRGNSLSRNDDIEIQKLSLEDRSYVTLILEKYFDSSQLDIIWMKDDSYGELWLYTQSGEIEFNEQLWDEEDVGESE